MKPNDSRYAIEFEYEGLGEGETKAGEICPSCEGGASKEASLSVSRRGGVLFYNCHRASCSFKGAIGGSTGAGETNEGSQPSRSESYIKTYPPNAALVTLLATKFGIPAKDFALAGLGWTGDYDGRYGRRVSYPIFGPDSRKRGENYRSYQGTKPKSIIKLIGEDSIASSWYRWKRASRVLVLVEDQVSAIKIAPYYHSLALLGTNLSEAKALEILYADKYDAIYLCLDNDATGEAIKTQLKWRDRIPNMRIVGLQKDVKDMNAQEFSEYLERLK